jgi:hypothetical protein
LRSRRRRIKGIKYKKKFNNPEVNNEVNNPKAKSPKSPYFIIIHPNRKPKKPKIGVEKTKREK